MSQQTEEGEGDSVYRLRPATRDDLDWIFRLEVEAYSAEYAVARAKLDAWYCANPEGFSVLTMNGEKIGQITLLPLRPVILESFVQGTILEQDIDAAGLYAPAERALVRNLHVESLIIRPLEGRSSPPIKAGMYFLRNFIPLLSRLCDPSNLEHVYALAASGRGAHLIEWLGFDQIKSGRERADGRSLYATTAAALDANIRALSGRLRGKTRA